MTIQELQRAYRSGKHTPTEVIHQIIEASKEYEDYNIWITKPDMEWIAPYLNGLQKLDKAKYPLWGIPFAMKDNIDLAGIPTTAACPAYAYTPTEHATVVQKLIEAGAIPVGKTNLDQFATGLVGTRSPYGEVHNAKCPERISGGSSSGSAVAVALGIVPFALGTDTAGSGRVPAALNGIVGYKPPLGAWSTKGVVPACASLDCVTVFTNNLDDAEIVDEIVKGYDPACSWSKRFEQEKQTVPETIYIPQEEPIFFGPFAKEYKKYWKEALRQLFEMGIHVEQTDCSYLRQAASILYDGPWVAERWNDLGEFVTGHTGEIFPVTETILRSGDNPNLTAASLFEAMHQLQAYKARTRELLKDAVLIMPTCGGTFTRAQVRDNPIETNSQMGLYTNHCNLLDLCAMDVPLVNEQTQDNPFGITIFSLAEQSGIVKKCAKLFL